MRKLFSWIAIISIILTLPSLVHADRTIGIFRLSDDGRILTDTTNNLQYTYDRGVYKVRVDNNDRHYDEYLVLQDDAHAISYTRHDGISGYQKLPITIQDGQPGNLETLTISAYANEEYGFARINNAFLTTQAISIPPDAPPPSTPPITTPPQPQVADGSPPPLSGAAPAPTTPQSPARQYMPNNIPRDAQGNLYRVISPAGGTEIGVQPIDRTGTATGTSIAHPPSFFQDMELIGAPVALDPSNVVRTGDKFYRVVSSRSHQGAIVSLQLQEINPVTGTDIQGGDAPVYSGVSRIPVDVQVQQRPTMSPGEEFAFQGKTYRMNVNGQIQEVGPNGILLPAGALPFRSDALPYGVGVHLITPSAQVIPGAPPPAAPAPTPTPPQRSEEFQLITGSVVPTNDALTFAHDDIVDVQQRLQGRGAEDRAFAAAIEEIRNLRTRIGAQPPPDNIDALSAELAEKLTAAEEAHGAQNVQIATIPTATLERIADSEGTLQNGIFLDPETGRYFKVNNEGAISNENVERFNRNGVEFAFSTDQLGLAFNSDGGAFNARNGAPLSPGDVIELRTPGTDDTYTGRVLSTATSDPTTSDRLVVETTKGFGSGFFSGLAGIFGGSDLSEYNFGDDLPRQRTRDYVEEDVEALRARFEEEATALETALEEGTLSDSDDLSRYLRVIGQDASTRSEADTSFLAGVALDQETQDFLVQTRNDLGSQLERILGIIENERDFDKLTSRGDLGFGDYPFPDLSPDDLRLLEALQNDQGQIPDLSALAGFSAKTPAERQQILSDFAAATGLDEVAAARVLEALEERERNADISTDRNSVIMGQFYGALSIMRYLGQIQSQYGGLGRFSALFMEDDDMLGIKEEVHQAFCDSVLFGDPSCRAQAFCELTPDNFAGGNVIIGGTAEQLSAAAHIEAFVYPPVVVENVTAQRGGRFSAERLYQVTYSVSLPSEDNNAYNVVFKGPVKTSRMFSSSQPLGESGSARRDRKNPFLRYSTNIYSAACIEFVKKITDFSGAKHRDLCVPIIVKQGAAPPRVTETADTSTTQRGESADF